MPQDTTDEFQRDAFGGITSAERPAAQTTAPAPAPATVRETDEYRGPGMPEPAFGPGRGFVAGPGTVAAGIGVQGVYTGDKPVTRGPSGDYYDVLFPPSQNIKPLQVGETTQDYYNRLRDWEQTAEGQAYKQQQEKQRWDEVNRIRQQMGGQAGFTAGPAAAAGPSPDVVQQAQQIVASVDPNILLRAVNIFSNPQAAAADPQANQVFQQLRSLGLSDNVLADIIQRFAMSMQRPAGTRTAASVLGTPSATVPANPLANALRV